MFKRGKHAAEEELPVNEVADIEPVEAGQLSDEEIRYQQELDSYVLKASQEPWDHEAEQRLVDQLNEHNTYNGRSGDYRRDFTLDDFKDDSFDPASVTSKYVGDGETWSATVAADVDELMEVPVSTATSPSYYEYPGGVQMRDITRWHTSNGGQAIQYVGRATRFDLKSKYQSEEGRIEDIDKAINFLEDEKKRLKGEF